MGHPPANGEAGATRFGPIVDGEVQEYLSFFCPQIMMVAPSILGFLPLRVALLTSVFLFLPRSWKDVSCIASLEIIQDPNLT
jgi:hypothetical protein